MGGEHRKANSQSSEQWWWESFGFMLMVVNLKTERQRA
jgi:hypothetical protein